MEVKIAKDDKITNYKVMLKDNKYEKDFLEIINSYGIKYKKTEYFKDFFVYKLIQINSEFIKILQEKALKYIFYIEPMSIYSLPIRIDEEVGEVPVIYPDNEKKYIYLGVLDNGISHIRYLRPWIKKVHSRYLIEDTSATHGTFVSGIALYGDKLEGKSIVENEGFYLLDATVLDKGRIEEDELLKNIMLAVEENHKKVKIWNLSLSVKIEIEEDRFSDFAVVLDYLQKKYSILIFKSGGNGGDFLKKRPKKKLYHGSDSLLSVVVASVNAEGYSSQFSRLGLGPFGTIKPDIASYGGELFVEEDGSMGMKGAKSFSVNGKIASSSGTSFANARMSSLATIIYQNICKDFDNYSDFDSTLIKALIIHSAKDTGRNLTEAEAGFGVPGTSKEILSYFSNDNIMIVQDTMKMEYTLHLDKKLRNAKKIRFTLVYETEFDFYQKGKYILSDIKIEKYSEDGENLVRKFEAEIKNNENIKLYSDNDIEKKFTIIVEKIN